MFAKLREFDAYTKPLEDFRIKTLTGGAVTLTSAIVIILLFLSELRLFLQTEIVEELFVDSSVVGDRVQISFNVTFPNLACPFVTVDAMDVSGAHQSNLESNIWKVRIDRDGNIVQSSAQKQELNEAQNSTATESAVAKQECGSCYGAETEQYKCCNTCDDVKAAYREKGWGMRDIDTIEQCKSESWVQKLEQHKDEGCQIYGEVQVAKVAGNFHIAPGQSLADRHSHVHDLHMLGPHRFDTTHEIKHLSFGKAYPGKVYPLDNHKSTTAQGGTMFQYFAKVVPTMYISSTEGQMITHQFSVTTHQKAINPGAGDGLPGLFLQYEFSPLMVKLSEKEKSLTHFLVSLCAIIGGVFTVASLIDSLIYHSSKALQQKMELGKAG